MTSQDIHREMAMTRTGPKPQGYLPPHPGEILFSRCLVPLRIAGQELAAHIGIEASRLDRLCGASYTLTADLAWRIAYAFGTNPVEWMKIQANYSLAKYRQENPHRETEHLLASPKNAERLLRSIREIESALPATDTDMKRLYARKRERGRLPFGLPKDPVHPGEILLEEFLKPNCTSLKAFSRRIGMHHSQLWRIARGQRPVRTAFACTIASAFGTSAEIWLGLQDTYDLVKAYPEVPPISMLDKVFLHNVPGLRDSIIEGMQEPPDACEDTPGW
jgi:addiction module HigA family antidote